MTTYERGTVVLVAFVYSDESGKKLRPALVLSSKRFQRARRETCIAAITSNVRRRLPGDHALADWKSAGLLFPSVVTGILRTVSREMIVRRLGKVSARDVANVDEQLRFSLDL